MRFIRNEKIKTLLFGNSLFGFVMFMVWFFVVLVMCCSCHKEDSLTISNKKALIVTNLSWSEIQWEVSRVNGIQAHSVMYADKYYTVIPEETFNSLILDKFNTFLSQNGMVFGDAKKNDCDDFARAFSFFSRAVSIKNKEFAYDLAVGELLYETMDSGHAINVAIVLDKNNKTKLLYIEPQGPQVMNGLPEDIKNNWVRLVNF